MKGWFKKHFDKDNNFVYVPSNHGLPELSDTVCRVHVFVLTSSALTPSIYIPNR